MKIFSQINHFIFEFNNSLLVKLFIFKPHLFFHEQHCIDVLILFIVILKLIREDISLKKKFIDGFFIASHKIILFQCFFIEV
jgi:hypothetical protein